MTTSISRSDGSWPVWALTGQAAAALAGADGAALAVGAGVAGLAVAGVADAVGAADGGTDGRTAADGAAEFVAGLGDGLLGVEPQAAATIATRPTRTERRFRACTALRLSHRVFCFAALAASRIRQIDSARKTRS